jgi:NAD(P)H-quinone oxidoreductase subunit 2
MNNIQDYVSALELLKPHICLAITILIVSVWNLFFPAAKRFTPFICLAGLGLAAVQLLPQFLIAPIALFGSGPYGLYTVDNLSVAFGLVVCGVGAIVVLMTMGLEHQFGENRGEFYTLLLIAVLSVMFLAGTTDLIMLFVALETLSLSCVLLTGLTKRDRKSNEASLKYLLSTAAVTATLLYGLSFVYGLTGSTNYYIIHEKLVQYTAIEPKLIIYFMTVLILSAVGFKLSAVPFHMWTPDVYEGAPTPVTAFLSIGSKAGGFVVAMRLLSFVFGSAYAEWGVIVAVLAMASMIVGNLVALSQTSLKRMLAYSSIAQVGYMLIGIVALPKDGMPALMFYIIVYAFMNLGAFAGAILFANETGSDNINDLAGLMRKRPLLAIGLSICLVNLAGLPIPPAGFLAKVFIFWSGVQLQSPIGWALVAVALVTSVPAIYYYCRPVIKMVVREPSEKVLALPAERVDQVDSQLWPALALAFCVIGIIFGSTMVSQFMEVSSKAVGPMTTPPKLGALPGPFAN